MAICGSTKHQTLQPSTQTLFKNDKSIIRIKRLVYRNIALIWIISIVGALPLVLLTRVNYLEFNQKKLKQSAWCGLAYNEPDKRWELIMLLSTIIFFLIPLIIITYLYYKIAKKLKKATKLDNMNSHYYQHQNQNQNHYQHHHQHQHQSDIGQLNDHVISRKIIQSRRIVIRMLGMYLCTCGRWCVIPKKKQNKQKEFSLKFSRLLPT